jgi:hypothetical protein
MTTTAVHPIPPGASTVAETNLGPLRAVIEAYLLSQGFYKHGAANGYTYWGHPELGLARTFEQVLAWQLGREMPTGSTCQYVTPFPVLHANERQTA